MLCFAQLSRENTGAGSSFEWGVEDLEGSVVLYDMVHNRAGERLSQDWVLRDWPRSSLKGERTVLGIYSFLRFESGREVVTVISCLSVY